MLSVAAVKEMNFYFTQTHSILQVNRTSNSISTVCLVPVSLQFEGGREVVLCLDPTLSQEGSGNASLNVRDF